MANECKILNLIEQKSFWQNIIEFDEKFEFVKKLGQGSFSTVVLARLRNNSSHEFAVKCLIPTTHPRRAITEFQILRKFGGRDNVINLLCAFRKNDRIFFLMDFFPHDHFPTFVLTASLDEIRDYIKNLLIALNYIHNLSIIHRDVKGTNFLFNRRLRRYRLIDFGLAEIQKEIDGSITSSEQQEKVVKRKCPSQEKNQNSLSPPRKKKTSAPKLLGSVTNLPINVENKIIPTNSDRLTKRNLFKEDNQKTQTKINVKKKSSSQNVCSCFGRSFSCKICNGKKSQKANKAGTAGFRAPEILLNHPHQTVAIDVWSAGIIFLGLLSRRYPFMRPQDDATALAQLITLFGTEKMVNLSAKLGKKLLCKPSRPLLNLKILCEIFRCDKQNVKNFQHSAEQCKICSRSVIVFGCYVCFCGQTSSVPIDCTNFLPETAYDLLEKLLDIDPSSRWTANAAFNHGFLNP